MKKILVALYTAAYKLKTWLSRGVSMKHTACFLLRTKVPQTNRVMIEGGPIEYTTLTVEGLNNEVVTSSELRRCKIKIVGNNNRLDLCHAKLFDGEIVVRGNNCVVEFGEGSSLGSGTIVCMGEATSITIGANTMMADNIDIWNSDTHPIFDSECNLINPSASIRIGEHVWLGKNVKVLKGVTIGDNAIVGMNAMVTKNISPNSLNVGTPAREIKTGVNWERRFIES